MLIVILSAGCRKERLKQTNLSYSVTINSNLDSTFAWANLYKKSPNNNSGSLGNPGSTNIEFDSGIQFSEEKLKFDHGIYTLALPGKIQNGIFDFSYGRKKYSNQIPTTNLVEPLDSVYIVRNNEEIEIPWDGPPIEEREVIFINGIPGSSSSSIEQVGGKSVTISGKPYNATIEVRFQRSRRGEIDSNKNLNTGYQISYISKPFTIQYIP